MITERIIEVKNRLIKRVEQVGLYENFGQREYLELRDKYGDCTEVDLFFDWCVNFN